MRRLATENDLHQVFAIYMHQDVVPFLGYDPMPLDGFRQVYRDLLQSGCFFVYEVSGRIAGFYKASRHPGRAHHVAYLGTLAVNPEFQGKGIARSMVEDAIDRLRESGVKRVELTVESDNPRAIAFYRKMGFAVEGTLRKFYKRASDAHYVDDHIMARLFNE
jgi:putative acetyltransferase